jgi:cell division protease FtsH
MAMTDEDKKCTAWHEAGHALVNVMLDYTHPLHKVTIIPRGQALGATMFLPKEDVLNRKRKELLDLITVSMAGRIAEEVVSDDISSGAAGDIQQATSMTRAMVCQWGMSDKLGMVQYGDSQEFVFLGREMARSKDYSENTAQEIDNEVKRIIDESYKRASDLIHTNRDKLELIAKCLLEYETLEGSQVEEIVRTGQFTPPPPSPQVPPPSGAQAATPLPEVMKPTPPKIDPGLGSAAPAPA